MRKYKIETKKEYYLKNPKIGSIVFNKCNREISFLVDPCLIIIHDLGNSIYIASNYKEYFKDEFYDSRMFYLRLALYCRKVNSYDTFILYNKYYLRKDLEFHFTIANMVNLLLINPMDEIFYDMVNYVCALYCPLVPDLVKKVQYTYKRRNCNG